ncbi:related to CRD1-cardiolipin synthase [Sporisorium reilianum SRZ2]|uniref:Related to CRD1-cardiolipin synthase n=1 Tax=Sporisorium reilianum (strain SRZ2) TaxID=999809 RepID=E6ZYW3_SPORE|nr:related to CRD1-cardiolipin synthase [Sporisorium reilianum SRZ2]
MALNVGMMWCAASASRAATASSATSACFRSPLLSTSSFSNVGLRTGLQRAAASQETMVASSRKIWTASRSMPTLTRHSHPWTRDSLFVSTRTFSSSSLLSNTPASSSSSPSPQPPKQPLSEDILTLPNLLTISRLLATPYIGYLVATHQFVPACTLLFLASVTDLLDGWLARRTGKYTVFGSIADPAADKALVTTMVISLALSGMLPWPLAAVILGRDVALVVSAFVIRYRTLEAPKTLARYFNPSLPSATVTPTQISKYNTFLQLLLLGVLTLYPILFPGQPSPGLVPGRPQTAVQADAKTEQPLLSQQTKNVIDTAVTRLMWITAATTVWSGIGYLGGAGARKVLAANAAQKMRNSLKKSTSPKA